MPDSALSQALKEAYASASSDEILLHTLDFWHPNFDMPIRVVLDHSNHWFGLEAGGLANGAPVNGSGYVEFIGFAFELTMPEMNDSGVPSISIKIDNVDRSIVGNIELSMGSPEQITVTYRPYLFSDPSHPQMSPPMTFQVVHIEADVLSVTANCTFGDMANKTFPGEVYTLERFPGLAG